jgi:hypothetical protein
MLIWNFALSQWKGIGAVAALFSLPGARSETASNTQYSKKPIKQTFKRIMLKGVISTLISGYATIYATQWMINASYNQRQRFFM